MDKRFSSPQDAVAWLNDGAHEIGTLTVRLKVAGRWRTFKNFADGLIHQNSWIFIDETETVREPQR